MDEGEDVILNKTFSDWFSEIILEKCSEEIGEQNQLPSQTTGQLMS